jgi:hypothetical protein
MFAERSDDGQSHIHTYMYVCMDLSGSLSQLVACRSGLGFVLFLGEFEI